MKRFMCSIVLVAFVVVFATAYIAQAATKEEAKALVVEAIAYWKANGKDKAIGEINDPKGRFVKGDLYVFANNIDGTVLANGGNQKLVGQNHIALKDPNGKLFNKESSETAQKGGGWVEYSWVHPQSKKVQSKTAWVQKVDGTDIYLGCGIWK